MGLTESAFEKLENKVKEYNEKHQNISCKCGKRIYKKYETIHVDYYNGNITLPTYLMMHCAKCHLDFEPKFSEDNTNGKKSFGVWGKLYGGKYGSIDTMLNELSQMISEHCCKCGIENLRSGYTHCNNCCISYDYDYQHCCKCKVVYNNNFTHCQNCHHVYEKNHCCKCQFDYDNTIKHCCKCQINYDIKLKHCCRCKCEYQGNHCCQCKKNYDSHVSHCCKCNVEWIGSHRCYVVK